MTPQSPQTRFIIIQIVRWSGVGLTLLGLMVMGGRLHWPAALGMALALIGIFEAMIVPVLLARRWRTPPE